MAVVKVESTVNLASSLVQSILGVQSETEGVFIGGVGTNFTQDSFGAKNFIQAIQSGTSGATVSSAPTKLTAVFSGNADGSTYKETVTVAGNALPNNFIGSPDPLSYISTLTDAGTFKQVVDGVTLYSGTYSSINNIYVNPTATQNGLNVFSTTSKESGFDLFEDMDGNPIKVSYSNSTSFTGDVFVDLSGDGLDGLNHASGLITKLSYTDVQSATGYAYNEKFSFTSADGFGFDTNNVFTGSISNLNFALATKEGTDTEAYSYAATGDNDLLADALTAYAAGEGSLDDITAALLFGNDVITGLDVAGEGDFLFAYNGNDKVDGLKGDDFVDGGNGNDTLNGGDGNDVLSGNAGNDSISGGNNDDFLEGEAGKDTIKGDAGNDTIVGGLGADILTGGLGNDRFEFNAKIGFSVSDSGISTLTMDRILDFKTGLDTIYIDLGRAVEASLIEFTTVTKNFGQALSVANSYFSGDLGATDNAYFVADATNGYLFADADNNGFADMAITLVGVNNAAKISAGDVTFSPAEIL